MKRITDPTFKYIPAHETDLRKTFARVRKEMKQKAVKVVVKAAVVRLREVKK